MPTNLTKDWIQYLKNNQIVAMQSDPSTGKLKYHRKVSVGDLKTFLKVNAGFDETAIDQAIQKVIGAPASTQEPAPAQQAAPEVEPPSSQLSQNPSAVKKREQRLRSKQSSVAGSNAFGSMASQLSPQGTVKEDIQDVAEPDISEKNVEDIFNILAPAAAPEPATPSKEDTTEELNQIKRAIRDNMNDAQRRSLWYALVDAANSAPPAPVTESSVTSSDVNAIFKTAVYLRDQPKSKWDFFKADKPKINIEDLKRAYEKDRPDDIRDIKHMLKDVGYDDREIEKIFGEVFGTDSKGEHNTPAASPTITKIAKYAQEKGMVTQLMDFMKKEYPETFTESVKVAIRDIEKIFEKIVKEERHGLYNAVRTQEYHRLGRYKK